MGTAEQGYVNLGKALNPYTKPKYTDSPSTTPQIESEKAAVESGSGKGTQPPVKTAKVTK